MYAWFFALASVLPVQDHRKGFDVQQGFLVERLDATKKLPKLFPKIVNVPLMVERITGKSRYADVINRCGDGLNSAVLGHSRPTNAHESTHMLNANLRTKHGRGAVYYGDGEALVYDEPKTTLYDSTAYVPLSLRSMSKFDYMRRYQGDYQHQPSSMLDELTAYISGTLVILEDGRSDDRVDVPNGVLELSICTIAVAMSSAKDDPDSWKEDSAFRGAVAKVLGQSRSVYDRAIAAYPRSDCDNIMKTLRTSADAAMMRDFIEKHFDGVWLK